MWPKKVNYQLIATNDLSWKMWLWGRLLGFRKQVFYNLDGLIISSSVSMITQTGD